MAESIFISSNDYTLSKAIRFVKYFNITGIQVFPILKAAKPYSRLEICPTTINCMTRIIHADHLCVVSYRSCIFRNIFCHNAARTYSGIIANFDMLNNADIWPYINIIANFCGLTAAICTNGSKLR